MTSTRIWMFNRNGFFCFCLILGTVCALTSSTSCGERSHTLGTFFQSVLGNPSSFPDLEELHKTTTAVPTMGSSEIADALPLILKALSDSHENVKGYSCAVLFAIAGRPDGADLLTGAVDAIGQDALTTKFEHVQAGEVVILGRIRPSPQKVTTILITFIKRSDRDPIAQAGAIFELVRIAPNDATAAATIQEFVGKTTDTSSKVAVINAIGTPNVKEIGIIRVVVRCLDDTDPVVRDTALQALTRMGRSGLEEAEPALHRLAVDPAQPPDVSNEAKYALETLKSLRATQQSH